MVSNPPIPRELSCGQAACKTGLALSMASISWQTKKRADSCLMTATCPLIVGVSLSCFLLLSPLLFINLQEAVDVLFCDLVVHHLLLRHTVFLIEFSLFCEDDAILRRQLLHSREFPKFPLVKCLLRCLMQKDLFPMVLKKSFVIPYLPIFGVNISCFRIVDNLHFQSAISRSRASFSLMASNSA